ncbi:TNT domain-containing protein [Mycobacteroides abscessus]|uniref:TNT domain-containing protein n=1 Tax=Mycobacteroides abscessus TaxID=36809 RepID=UPI002105ED20|nr:TNT domain-containing protein [Mycobacteroides abscessus]
MSLSLAEIKRAKVQTFRDVADGLEAMAEANRDMKRGVERLPIMGDAWKGLSGDAAHHELDGHNRYLEGHADAQTSAAGKIRAAADEFEGVQQLLKKIENDAANGKFSINYDTGEVTPPNGKYDKNELDYLTNTLRQIQAAGDRANTDLEAAVKAAKTLPDPSGAAAQALPAVLGSAIKPNGAAGALQNLAAPNPDGDPGATKAAAAGTDTQANYKEWYPKNAVPVGDKNVDPSKLGGVGSIPGVRDNVDKTPQPTATRPVGAVQPFDPNSPATKAGLNALRKDLESKGWTPQQIDSGLNRMLTPGKTVDEPSPWKSPDGKAPPRPGFGEGFGDGWNSFFDRVHNLTGQEGVDKFVDGWKDLGKGVGTEIFQRTVDPIGAGIGDVKDARDLINSPNPGYTVGHIAGEAAPGLATLPFGGEGMAVRAGLPAELLTEGGAPAAVLKDWNPTGGMPWKDFESQFGTPGEARIWPTENQGFPPGYVPHDANLPAGTIIDRFGSEFGRYLAPDGTPFADRALAPESVGGAYNRYMVTGEPLPPGWRIVEGPLQPFYGQTPQPGTVQYMIEAPDGVRPTVWELERLGIISKEGPPLGR